MILTIVGSILGGGLIGVILNYGLGLKKHRITEFQALVDELKEFSDKQQLEIKELKELVETYRKEQLSDKILITKLKSQLNV